VIAPSSSIELLHGSDSTSVRDATYFTLGHPLAHRAADHLVVVRQRGPATVRESAARVLVSTAWRLHHAVETDRARQTA
jgi:hypothetical protein